MTGTKGKTPEIKAELMRRFPCGAAPTGTWAELSAEFGVSRERVRQIAGDLGIARVNRGKPPRQCRACGAVITQARFQFCTDCRTVPLCCDVCGVVFRRHRATVITHANNPRYARGQSYCSWKCRNEGSTGTPNLKNRRGGIKPEAGTLHGRVRTYNHGCHCDECRGAAMAYLREYRLRKRAAR